jgi:hypothetical protein
MGIFDSLANLDPIRDTFTGLALEYRQNSIHFSVIVGREWQRNLEKLA